MFELLHLNEDLIYFKEGNSFLGTE